MADRVPEAWGPGETALGRGRARACESLGNRERQANLGQHHSPAGALAAIVKR
jgi:hypothetical protein